jgi:uncharacterized protein YdhG (YjbR/CyaY superfamily)
VFRNGDLPSEHGAEAAKRAECGGGKWTTQYVSKDTWTRPGKTALADSAEARANKNKAEGESDVLAKIDEMLEPERVMARRLHEIIKASAPVLAPKTWYGMPAYAKDGKIVCFFQCAQKFNTRYATLGFSDTANLDDDAIWPVTFALKELTATEEAKIAALVKKAVS